MFDSIIKEIMLKALPMLLDYLSENRSVLCDFILERAAMTENDIDDEMAEALCEWIMNCGN